MKGYAQTANVLKALAHPVRLQIMQILREEGEACVCHLEARLDQRQAYISQHLAKLREVGLVVDRREGLNVFYAIPIDGIDILLEQASKVAVETAYFDAVEQTLTSIRKLQPQQCGCPKCEEKIGLIAASG
jgi:ArsR family transcriptional regulator